MLDALAQFDNTARAERSKLGKISKVKAGYWQVVQRLLDTR
jgi:hypothetical protein